MGHIKNRATCITVTFLLSIFGIKHIKIRTSIYSSANKGCLYPVDDENVISYFEVRVNFVFEFSGLRFQCLGHDCPGTSQPCDIESITETPGSCIGAHCL